MSTSIRIFRLLLPVTLLSAMFFFSSCEEESGKLEAVVIVKYLGDTATVVPGANIVLEKNDIHIEGVSDANGEFYHVFELEAILDIIATKDTGAAGTPVILTGASVIRLKPDKTVYRTVYIGQ